MEYLVRRKGYLRGYRLSFNRDGILVVTVSKLSSIRFIESILKKHQRWIDQNLNKIEKSKVNFFTLNLLKSQKILLLGQEFSYIVLFVNTKRIIGHLNQTEKQIYIKVPIFFLEDEIEKKLGDKKFLNDGVGLDDLEALGLKLKKENELINKKYKEKIQNKVILIFKKLLLESVESYIKENKQLEYFQFKNITIKNLSSKWGSCSSKKNLNFNYKLIFCPYEVIEYVIIHEMCHLKEMNHSKRFWNLVESYLPEYKKHRKWIRDNGERFIKIQYTL